MKKAEHILFDKKKEQQLLEDYALGPAGRFKKMFHLISISLLFSPTKKLKEFDPNDGFITLKRVINYRELAIYFSLSSHRGLEIPLRS